MAHFFKLTWDLAYEMCPVISVPMYMLNAYSARIITLCNESHCSLGNLCTPLSALPGCAPMQQYLLPSSVKTRFFVPLDSEWG